ncbi:hypothetical protein NicSoilB11_04120 [Arthrobacter sp. NicSoilB11]|nr:hypothetical protein StoSoilB19_03820 [Arthrobacter sp. StoSoilB19]BCW74087.1 hypothetical protein NicSoilB11_04120 [Arthrobacter sp. NicSoilB11]
MCLNTEGCQHLDQRLLGNGMRQPIPALEGRTHTMRVGQLLQQVRIDWPGRSGGRACWDRWAWCVLLV